MSKQLYDDQTLTQYLLGALSEAETERVDELSLTDDEVAEALQMVEQDLVDAYVQDELTAAAHAQFKSYYLASPRRREKVAFAQAFQAQALKSPAPQASGAQTEVVAEIAPQRKSRSWFSVWRGFNASRPAWQWGAAVAALALLIAGSWLLFEHMRPRQQTAQTQTPRAAPEQREQDLQKELENRQTASAQSAEERARVERERLAQERTQHEQQRTADEQPAAAQQRAARQQQSSSSASRVAFFVLVPQMRGASQTQTISIPSQTAYVAMRLNLEPNEFSTYRVDLLDETGGQTLWRSSQLKAHAAGGGQVLNLSFRARLLKPQTRYVLRVTGGATEIVDDYPFRVVK
jgi:adenylate kinase family enzyme